MGYNNSRRDGHQEDNQRSASLLRGACRPRHTRAMPGLFRIMLYSYHEDQTRRHVACPQTPCIAYACLHMHRRTYSVQCSDEICFPQLRIKCGIARSCLGTHTALQAPITSTKRWYNIPLVLVLCKLQTHDAATGVYCSPKHKRESGEEKAI